MKILADGLFQLGGFPPNAINVYLMDGILIDAGSRFDRGRILRQLKGHKVTAHALTHAHPDHQGASHAVCEALNLPFWCSEGDADAAEDPRVMLSRMRRHWINREIGGRLGGPGHPVSRRLRAGDEIGSFRVIETPGHSAGHVSYWRESDRTLILGDVLANMKFATARPGLREPPTIFTLDPSQNRESARAVARLDPRLICFGHGPPLRDTGNFVRFIEALETR
jgi:glyoxylase-like metal-dependent hydrolase (beta-lactamase superfamily II)